MLFDGDFFQVLPLDQGLVELSFNTKRKTVNILSLAALNELAQAVDVVKERSGLSGLLISSGKSAFILGADITEFLALFQSPEAELASQLQKVHDIFNTIEDLPVPTVTAVNGDALGGGCELALTTDYRVLATNASIGLPEVNLGIIPGLGGSVRLPRLIGAENALEWMAKGKTHDANSALKVAVADAVVEPGDLHNSALDLLKRCIKGDFPYLERRKQKKGPLRLRPLEAAMAFETAKGLVFQAAGPHYPAPMALVGSLQKACFMGREEATEVEISTFIGLSKTDVCTSLIGLFLNNQMLNKIAARAAESARPINQAGVLGAGIMGGGIAYQSALKGIPVVMKDIADKSLDLGMSEAVRQLNRRLERGRLQPMEMAKIISTIKPTLTMADIAGADIVIEAVVENPKVKLAVLSDIEKAVDDDTIITSNTSTISIDSLAKALNKPERFCGMHFFNPVPVMPLVEVIRGKDTSEDTINSVVAYATRIGKSPIVVNNCPGFFVNRILFPYLMGFNLLIRDGADFRLVDKVMEQFGWPMGPAYLQDVIGIDTCYHALAVMEAGFPNRMKFADQSILDELYEAKRFGQKNGKGFYHYEPDKKGRPAKVYNEDVEPLIQSVQGESKEFDHETIIARMMAPLCLETVRCLEEGIVDSPAEADMALIMGIGFPKFRGGALRYIDSLGVDKFCQIADRFAALGELYQVTDGLRDMAKSGKTFF
jgi:3-hydroxyacyl-CoA dehydrogenase/enoyl-CoA hydratase/3-hydroxybutyryl-CoA epimerase/enoyl-CoA isomerase